MFQAGYLAGFIDCVRLAKGMDSRGYVATNYILPRGAKLADYQAWINEEYKKPETAERTLPQMLVLASHAMEAKFGPEQPIGNMGALDLKYLKVPVAKPSLFALFSPGTFVATNVGRNAWKTFRKTRLMLFCPFK